MSAPREDMRRLLFARCGELGLNREERLEFANMILYPRDGEEITSFTQLDAIQVARLLDAFNGFEKMNVLLNLRVRPDIPPPDPEQGRLFA